LSVNLRKIIIIIIILLLLSLLYYYYIKSYNEYLATIWHSYCRFSGIYLWSHL